jgi:hypothetical protein
MSTQHSEPKEDGIRAVYDAVNKHWSHAEQLRWSILYNFLTANSILVVAWAAIYSQKSTEKTILITLPVVGFIMSILWCLLEHRANTFVKGYGELGGEVEKQLPLGLGHLGPFKRGEEIREGKYVGGRGRGNLSQMGRPCAFILSLMDRLGACAFIPSACFAVVVPALFALVYIVLLGCSISLRTPCR